MATDAEVHPSLLKRKIIHFDMDAFYANVEIRDRPDLKGRPVIVGGSPQSRGVVCTASYEARKFGVKSAMACSKAYRLCPDAVFLKPDFEKYLAVSTQIREIFGHYTEKIEPLSLDEAYLDVTDNPKGLFAVKIARMIQLEILETLKLTGSAGVAPNKMVAKIASDIRKPFGITVVLPAQVHAFMQNLPLRKIHGIGPAGESRLAEKNLRICSDVWPFSLAELTMKLGAQAEWLFNRSRGIDDRDLCTSRLRKSIGRETTFAVDTSDPILLDGVLQKLVNSVASTCQRGELAAKTVTIKVKYDDFTQVTRSLSADPLVSVGADILDRARTLIEQTDYRIKKIRLLGVSLSALHSPVIDPGPSLNL